MACGITTWPSWILLRNPGNPLCGSHRDGIHPAEARALRRMASLLETARGCGSRPTICVQKTARRAPMSSALTPPAPPMSSSFARRTHSPASAEEPNHDDRPSRCSRSARSRDALGYLLHPNISTSSLGPMEEQAEFGVVVPGVQVLQARVGVEAFADPAFGFGGSIAGEEPFGLLAEGFVEGALDLNPRRRGDRPDRGQPVAVEVGGGGGGGAVQEFDGGMGVGGNCSAPVIFRFRASTGPGGGGGGGGAGSGAGRSFVHAGQAGQSVGNQGLGCGR
ncbi:hypothetical protein MCELHM10_03900 [Paracoccaceae bacterium]